MTTSSKKTLEFYVTAKMEVEVPAYWDYTTAYEAFRSRVNTRLGLDEPQRVGDGKMTLEDVEITRISGMTF